MLTVYKDGVVFKSYTRDDLKYGENNVFGVYLFTDDGEPLTSDTIESLFETAKVFTKQKLIDEAAGLLFEFLIQLGATVPFEEVRADIVDSTDGMSVEDTRDYILQEISKLPLNGMEIPRTGKYAVGVCIEAGVLAAGEYTVEIRNNYNISYAKLTVI